MVKAGNAALLVCMWVCVTYIVCCFNGAELRCAPSTCIVHHGTQGGPNVFRSRGTGKVVHMTIFHVPCESLPTVDGAQCNVSPAVCVSWHIFIYCDRRPFLNSLFPKVNIPWSKPYVYDRHLINVYRRHCCSWSDDGTLNIMLIDFLHHSWWFRNLLEIWFGLDIFHLINFTKRYKCMGQYLW